MIERATATLAREQDKPYTTIMNDALDVIRLPDSLAIYTYLQSKTERWIVRRQDVMNRFGFGKDRYHKAMKHLRDVGLISNTQTRDNETGKILDTQLVVHYMPVSSIAVVRDTQSTAEPDSGKQGHIEIKDSLEIKDNNNTCQYILDAYNQTIDDQNPNWSKAKLMDDSRVRLIKRSIKVIANRAKEIGDEPHEYLARLVDAISTDPFYSGRQPSMQHPDGYRWGFEQVLSVKNIRAAYERLSE